MQAGSERRKFFAAAIDVGFFRHLFAALPPDVRKVSDVSNLPANPYIWRQSRSVRSIRPESARASAPARQGRFSIRPRLFLLLPRSADRLILRECDAESRRRRTQ